jgi:hypothetical protein
LRRVVAAEREEVCASRLAPQAADDAAADVTAAAAVVSAFAGMRTRGEVVRALKVPDIAVALVEDAVAYVLAGYVARQ